MDMGGMDMGGSASGSPGAACKISMLYNWYTVDSCFLAKSWHVHTLAQFAGSVIGVFFLVALIEGVRRVHREFDRRLIAKYLASSVTASGSVDSLNKGGPALISKPGMVLIRPTLFEQTIRAAFYGVQFTAAFLTMLLGMYYNGYILFGICFGASIGYLLFARDTLVAQADLALASGCCC